MRNIVIAPSEIAWLYDSCPRCFWAKCQGIAPRRPQLPAIFNQIDKAQKIALTIEHLQRLGIPAVQFLPGEDVRTKWEDYDGVRLQIKGKTDLRVMLDDGTVGILDLKTSEPRAQSLEKYGRQLHAYQRATEHPFSDVPHEVTYLGLIVFTPDKFVVSEGALDVAYRGKFSKWDFDINRAGFDQFLHEVAALAGSDVIPDPGACDVCAHYTAMTRLLTERRGA